MESNLKVMQWNICNEDDILTGAKRYEDELFNNVNQLINVERIRRTTSRRSYLMDIFKYKTNDADVVHATFQTLAPLKILKRPKNFVLTVHDIIPKVYFTTNQKIINMWYLLQYAIPKADKIIVDSEFTKSELITRLDIDENKIHVVLLGVNEKYKLLNKEECKIKFNLNPNIKYIIIASSNQQWKNMGFINKIVDKIDNYMFIKVGYGHNLTNPKVINLGNINEIDMPYLYNACDLILNASLYEGFGLPVLEAMACGCPVVSSDSASIPEVVQNAGILLDAHNNIDNVNKFVQVINNVLTDEQIRIKMIERGLKRAKELSWVRTAKETVDVYKKVL